jgi:mono/diheme cytochrome c family protein
MQRAVVFIILLATSSAQAAAVDDPAATKLERGFQETVRPFVETYCITCHGRDKAKGDLDLSIYSTSASAARDYPRWELVAERLDAKEMPPQKAKQHPSPAQSRQVIEWVQAVRKYEAHKNAGDPGPVFARRLSNAEYDYTIRDLTGVDLRPAKEFPVDPANEAGFDNSGESLTMTPSLVKKYLEAARVVSEHLVLESDGIEFAPHPVVADTDRDKFCVNRIIRFYQRQHTDYADYFLAAWRYKNRAALGLPKATLDDVAKEADLSAKYLATIWATLTGTSEDVGPIAALQALWGDLPVGGNDQAAAARAGCMTMRDFVVSLRAKLVPHVANLTSPAISDGSQPLVLWKDRQFAGDRMRYAGDALKLAPVRLPEGSAAARAMAIPAGPDAAARYESTFTRFCETFPDAFFVSERARIYLDPKGEKDLTGRLLSAGFHNQMGYFRDDGPLYQLMLNEGEQRELDRLWREFDYVASIPARQYSSFLWYERAESSFVRGQEFDFVRAEDKDAVSEAKIKRVSDVYLSKALRRGAGEVAVKAIEDYFNEISDRVRRVERASVAAEPIHLQALLKFTERAYRRPLTNPERDGIIAFYHSLRKENGLSHEDAMRDAIVSVLMSPHFCYRLDLPRKGDGQARPLDDYALASRLSYFLWASMPDQQLLDLAASGELHRPEVLVAQTKRMLRDERARGLAVEFTGNWLDFRRFQEHNSVDRARFPEFNNGLREAMFEEPVRFFLDVARRDASVLDFLYGDYTFVNPTLARHYGMPLPDGAPGAWARVDNAKRYDRGGLLPMAVFLTKNSPGLRTSPVKRGNWVVKRILGERIPPPPPKVPELPSDESKLDLTLRQTLERHRADPTCAACHARFDSMGLVFEGYGPVGESRKLDLGGRPVDARATFPSGAEGSGLAGLRTYIHDRRENDFVENLCRRILAYGLGRTLLISDDETVAAMRNKLAADGYRFDNLIEVIVTSPQFLNKRANTQVSKE